MKRFLLIAVTFLLGTGLCLQGKAEGSRNPAAKRIISLAPNLTETLFALGAGSEVVGVTTFCKYPPEAARIEKVGNFLNPNYEKIVDLKPTLILAEQWPSSKTAVRLKQLRLPLVETLSPRSFDEIY